MSLSKARGSNIQVWNSIVVGIVCRTWRCATAVFSVHHHTGNRHLIFQPLRRVSGGLNVAVGFNPRGGRRMSPRRVSDG